MGKPSSNFSFDRWVRHVFEHPANSEWWWNDDGAGEEYWDERENDDRTLDYLIYLFESPRFLLDQYSSAQIDQGLHYIVSPSCSNHMYVLCNTDILWEQRGRCIRAMTTLYAELMAPVYGDRIANTSKPGRATELHWCFLWWDVIPLWGDDSQPDRECVQEEVFGVFEKVLTFESEACLESVLHGLGHWHCFAEDRVERMVRHFLATRNDISEDIRAYAECAAVGGVQ